MSTRAGGTDGHVWALIAGGGTAGHLLPGLAVAGELVARGHDRSEVLFVGSARGPEARLVPDAGFAVEVLGGRGIQRRLTLANVGAAIGLLRAFVAAWRIVGRARPRVVVTLGGYASVACSMVAVLRRIPLVVMEQNARAGLANRLVGRFARACAVPFAVTDLPRAVVTGNPVRAEITAVEPGRDRAAARAALDLPQDRVVVAAFSGSLGAARINAAVRDLARQWSARADVAIRHVTGARDWEALSADPLPVGGAGRYEMVRYEDRMDLLLAAADVVVARAGGSTVAELSAVGVPSVLVPLPIATRDHQTANARVLAEAGAAVVVADAELDGDRLARELAPIVADARRRVDMAAAARRVGRRDAAGAVADLVEAHAR